MFSSLVVMGFGNNSSSEDSSFDLSAGVSCKRKDRFLQLSAIWEPLRNERKIVGAVINKLQKRSGKLYEYERQSVTMLNRWILMNFSIRNGLGWTCT